MDGRFEVSTEGFRQLQAMRQPWRLAKELVSNAFDEDVTGVTVSITPGERGTELIVEDDGPGFRDIRDAWTLYGPTRKRLEPTVRGRFNLGEKELMSVALAGRVETTGGRVTFPEEGGRIVEEGLRRKKGARVSALMPWTRGEAEEVERS